jgi:NADPH-dependent 2,4-dienoyl-CoA reductase/sulfur reductase-like enzyme
VPEPDVERLAFKTGDAPGILTVRRAGEGRRQRPTKTYVEPAREVPVFAETDVLIVGGGPAGCAAAVGAARVGADVLLLERYGYLGGLSTGGLVIWIDRMTDWDGRQVIAGFARDILDRLPHDAVAGAAPGDWGLEESTVECILASTFGIVSGHRHVVAAGGPGMAQIGVVAAGRGTRRPPGVPRAGCHAYCRGPPGPRCSVRE